MQAGLVAFRINAWLSSCQRSPQPYLTGAGVGVSALTANRQATTVAQATVATQIHQTLDVHCHFAAEVAFHAVIGVDNFAQLLHFIIAELVHALRFCNARGLADFGSPGRANSINILKPDHNPLGGRDIHAGNTCHAFSPVRPP